MDSCQDFGYHYYTALPLTVPYTGDMYTSKEL